MKIAVLGSTGSIGQNTVSVAKMNPDISLRAVAANRNIDIIEKQIEDFNPKFAVISDKESFETLTSKKNFSDTELLYGTEGLRKIVEDDEIDIIVNGMSGISGLMPTVWALEAGKKVAIANKESIVMGWDVLKNKVNDSEMLIPVDSEHSAIFQTIKGELPENIEKIYLTASGGAVYKKTNEELGSVTPEECLKHPTWAMGDKITIDSATLMNKGIEVIEANRLFGIEYNKIGVVIHPQSIVHGMVEYTDGSIIAYLSKADMRIPIQYSLSHPGRLNSQPSKLSISDLSNMEFMEPDKDKFPSLELAIEAGKSGTLKSIVLCAADEVAVRAFLSGKIKFTEIPAVIEKALSKDMEGDTGSLNGVKDLYDEAEKKTKELI